MNDLIFQIDNDDDLFDVNAIQALDLRDFAKGALAEGHDLWHIAFRHNNGCRGDLVISGGSAGICFGGNSIYGDWVTCPDGESYLVSDDKESVYDDRGNQVTDGERLHTIMMALSATIMRA